MKRQAGFTLIELVMVIVILGILSAFALPRFADLGNDARAASLQGAYGSVKSASSIVHAEALVTSTTGATGSVSLEGTPIALIFGYPAASAIGAAAQIADDFVLTPTAAAGGAAGFVTVSATNAADDATCVFTYTEPLASGDAGVISTIDTSGC